MPNLDTGEGSSDFTGNTIERIAFAKLRKGETDNPDENERKFSVDTKMVLDRSGKSILSIFYAYFNGRNKFEFFSSNELKDFIESDSFKFPQSEEIFNGSLRKHIVLGIGTHASDDGKTVKLLAHPIILREEHPTWYAFRKANDPFRFECNLFAKTLPVNKKPENCDVMLDLIQYSTSKSYRLENSDDIVSEKDIRNYIFYMSNIVCGIRKEPAKKLDDPEFETMAAQVIINAKI